MKGNKDDTLFPRERNVVMAFQSHARYTHMKVAATIALTIA
jgi:ABC-type sugar transport system ATPase subunit